MAPDKNSIEHSTIPISKAAIIVFSFCSIIISLVGGYYSSKQGTRDAINEIKLDLRDQTSRNNLQDILITGNSEATKFHYDLIQKLRDKAEIHDLEIQALKLRSTKTYR